MRLRILVADDNQDSANSCALLLQLSGHDVRVAYSGGAALEIAAKYLPHLALIDIRMPHMDGYEVARRMRAEKGGKSILLVAVTGLGQMADKLEAESAGFDLHLAKPYNLESLKPLIARCSPK